MIVLAVILYALIAVYELVPLYKQRQWKDFWVNAVLGTFSFTIAILLCLGIDIPSPARPIQEAITLLFGK